MAPNPKQTAEETFPVGERKFYVHYNGASWFVKEGSYFEASEDGDWKKSWSPIYATSIEHARLKAAKEMTP